MVYYYIQEKEKMENSYNEIIDEVYDKYDELFDSYYPAFSAPYPKRLTKEELVQEIKNGGSVLKEFQLDVKITERELSLEERFNLRYPGGKFSVFQENYPNTHKRNDPNGLLDAFDIPTKIITLEYKEEKVSYYE